MISRNVFDKIPVELKRLDQFVLWKSVGRDGKPTKMPVQPDGSPAATNDQTTWSSFNEVVAAYEANPRKFAGIGFVFSEHDPYTGIDLDGCLDGGEIAEWAKPWLTDLAGGYAEVSPSGTGVKVWVKAKLDGGGKRRKVGDDKHTAIEVYDRLRFFCLTGDVLSDPAGEIPSKQDVVNRLYALVKPVPVKAKAPVAYHGTDSPVRGDRVKRAAAYLATVDAAIEGKGGDDWTYHVACVLLKWFGLSVSEAWPLFQGWNQTCSPPWDDARLERKLRQADESPDDQPRGWKLEENRDDWRPTQRAKAQHGVPAAVSTESRTPTRSPRMRVVISNNEMEVNDQSVKALGDDPDLYRLGYALATILDEGEAPRGVDYGKDNPPPQIRAISTATLRERLSSRVNFIKLKHKDDGTIEELPAHPPDWAVKAVHERGMYPGIRPIEGLIESPTLRRDGSILDQPGYDASTRLFYRPTIDFPKIPDRPTRAEAEAALALLLDVVCDFPFKSNAHRAVWVTALLTVLARSMFDGPAPLIGFDANVPGAGKTILADLISRIATGRKIPKTSYPGGPNSDEEMRKRITSIALAGDRMTLLDNIAEPMGGAALDAALTTTVWRDRILGQSSMTAELPLNTIWFASGNNLQCKGDLLRRVLFARLESPLENPEERQGFRHADLFGYVLDNRAKIVIAALTIIRAYRVSGEKADVAPLGSFEAWTRAIVEPVAWIMGVNPLSVQKTIRESDQGDNLRNALVSGWAELPGSEGGVTVADAIKLLKNHADKFGTLRSALMELSHNSDLPTTRSIGKYLTSVKGRVVDVRDEDAVAPKLRVLTGKPGRTGVVAWKITAPSISAGFAGFSEPVQGLEKGQTMHLNSLDDNALSAPAGFAGFDSSLTREKFDSQKFSLERPELNPANHANPAPLRVDHPSSSAQPPHVGKPANPSGRPYDPNDWTTWP